jgi:hypothetical protein
MGAASLRVGKDPGPIEYQDDGALCEVARHTFPEPTTRRGKFGSLFLNERRQT